MRLLSPSPQESYPDLRARDKFLQPLKPVPSLNDPPLDVLQAPRLIRPQPSRDPENLLGHAESVHLRLEGLKPRGATRTPEEWKPLTESQEGPSRHQYGGLAPGTGDTLVFSALHAGLHCDPHPRSAEDASAARGPSDLSCGACASHRCRCDSAPTRHPEHLHQVWSTSGFDTCAAGR